MIFVCYVFFVFQVMFVLNHYMDASLVPCESFRYNEKTKMKIFFKKTVRWGWSYLLLSLIHSCVLNQWNLCVEKTPNQYHGLRLPAWIFLKTD